MTQFLQPGNVEAWSGDDPAASIDEIFAEQTWPLLWPKFVYAYANAGARSAELAGLGPADSAFAYTKDTNTLWAWSGTTWTAVAGGDPVWLAYTANWRNQTGTGLAIGNGTQTYRYRRNGRVIHATGELTRQSTTNTSSGGDHYLWDLPTPARSSNAINGSARVVAGGAVFPCIVYGIGSSTVVLVETATGKRVGNSVSGGALPAPSPGDNYSFTVTYEAAS